MVNVQEELDLVAFRVSKEPHIRLNAEVCESRKCTICVYVCPAGLFTVSQGEMLFSYEGCLECGACRVACPYGALEWGYPKGGYGVCFRAS